MKIREIYSESIKEGFDWLTILIEFLVFKKEVLTFEDESSALDLYFKKNNQKRMNKLLLEYREKLMQFEHRTII